MPLTDLESRLRQQARARIARGDLPCETVVQVWGAKGAGKTCSLCGESISASDVEYEVALQAGTHLSFHIFCHSLWQLECARALTLRNLASQK